ncbi:MAG: cysteine desulfurase NifS [Clostridia bacterium]|nr:cysteine desulfurase NifS [Clostridia bacterium]MBR2874601.1 cysteine desulfurase NifS [Clostridia bacterium]
MKRVYLDHAATTYVLPEVLKEMEPYFTDIFGNASSLHSFGQEGAVAVAEAREKVAKVLGANSNEIYFTSCGTESNNWALRGIAYKKGKGHIITSQIEHPAILQTCADLEKKGFEVSYIGVNNNGIINLEELKKAIRPDTILISVMSANNEMGAIQPIEEIAKIAKENKIPFHTDAVQAIGAIKFNVKEMGIDMLSLSGHKFYGPKGIGVLYIRNGLGIAKFMTGGEQERNMRAGTTNTPLIVGLAKAITLAYENFDQKVEELAKKRDYLINRILTEIPYSSLNGDSKNRLPNNVNISYKFIEGESILMLLDFDGIAVSTGSACSSGSLKSSHVLLAMGTDIELAHSSVRMTLGEKTTYEDLDYTVDCLKKVIENLRNMSPLFAEFKGGITNV